MQRVLRSRSFYLGLVLFVGALLYYGIQAQTRALREQRQQLSNAELSDFLDAEEPPELPSWVQKELDVETVRRIAMSNLSIATSLAILGLFLLGMALGGIVLCVRALMAGRRISLWPRPTLRPPAWTFGELGRIFLLVLLIIALLPIGRLALIALWPDLLDMHLWMTVSMLFIDGFLLLAIFAFAVGKSRPPRAALGLASGKVLEPIGAGFRGYVALFPWLLLSLVVIAQLASHFQFKPPVQPIQMLLFVEERPLVLALTVLLTCVVGPLAEEVFFRGVVFGALRQRLSRTVSMLISGALFALVHSNAVGFVPIWALGCLLAERYERTGSLVSPIAVHVLHNTFLLSIAMTYRAIMLMS